MCDNDSEDCEDCANCADRRDAVETKMKLVPSEKMICGNAHRCLAIDAEFPEECDSAVEHALHPTCALPCLGHVCVPKNSYDERVEGARIDAKLARQSIENARREGIVAGQSECRRAAQMDAKTATEALEVEVRRQQVQITTLTNMLHEAMEGKNS